MLAGHGEIKEIKDALAKCWSTSCPITYRNQTRMLKSAFVRICLKNQAARVTGWADGQRGYSPAYSQCAACKTGKLIAAGLDFPQPEYTEWIEEVEAANEPPRREPALFADIPAAMERAGLIKQPKENAMEVKVKEQQQSSPFKVLPAVTDSLKMSSLKTLWRLPVLAKGEVGVCVNCGRDNCLIRDGGVCSSCQKATIKKQGQELLDSLAAAKKRLHTVKSKNRQVRGKRAKKAVKVRPAPAAEQSSPAVSAASPLADLGQKYINFGRKLQDRQTPIGELVAMAAEMGMEIDINIRRRNGL